MPISTAQGSGWPDGSPLVSPANAGSRGPAEETRTIARRGMTAALATLDQATGHPYASLVLVATTADGSPILLLSRLARHTRNLLAEPRASLLFDGTAGTADPLAGNRATLIGRIGIEESPAARRRFLARHPSAAGYVDFGDFAFFRLAVERAHFVGGFGRIVELPAAELLTNLAGAEQLIAAESDIIAHMNTDHADAVGLYATTLAGAEPGPWRMTGIDPAGADLVMATQSVRIAFSQPIATPGDARRVLADLAHAARGPSPTSPERLT